MIKTLNILLVLSLFCIIPQITNATGESKHKKDFPVVDSANLMNVVRFLASPNLKGRLPGTSEYNLAGRFAQKYFESIDIKHFPQHNKYRQNLNIKQNIFYSPCDFAIYHYENGKINLAHGDNYNFRGYTGSNRLNTETVFCGFGIDSEDYSDYKNIDVQGKTVLIFKSNPNFSDINYEKFSISARAHTAKRHGAVAVIYIPSPNSQRTDPIGSVMFGDYSYIPDMPLIQTDFETAELLIEGSEYNLKELYESINKTQEANSFHLKSRIEVNVQTKFTEKTECFNIIGYLKGKEPEYADEYIVISAHMDHVGYQCDVIYPGANDNASGTAAVMELARIFVQNPTKRSIIFVLYTGEEQGLIGASYFAENLPIKKENIVAAFNFDCIGVGDSLQIGNGLSNPKLYDLALKKDKYDFIINSTWKGGGADLTPLHKIGIPGLYFVTRDSYTYLHLPEDTPETLNSELFKKVVRTGYEIINTVANGKYEKEEIVKWKSVT